jgi:hydroxymethylpyrimidine/phosphomethylpyrimidine kinase
MIKKVLTISGSDCSGVAGMQADIKTIAAHRMYAMSVITTLLFPTAAGGGVYETPPEIVAGQLECCFAGHLPDAVKIGRVPNAGIMEVVAGKLSEYNAQNIVIDPETADAGAGSTAGVLVEALISRLFPFGTVITPNIPEAEALSGIDILSGRNTISQQNMIRAAGLIAEITGCAVLIKGGRLECSADDLLYDKGVTRWFPSERIGNPDTRGAGSTLSTAIACNLAAGYDLAESVRRAKAYVTGALKAGLLFTNGRSLLDHMWQVKSEE